MTRLWGVERSHCVSLSPPALAFLYRDSFYFLLLQWIVPRFSADPVANGGVVLVLRGDWDFI